MHGRRPAVHVLSTQQVHYILQLVMVLSMHSTESTITTNIEMHVIWSHSTATTDWITVWIDLPTLRSVQHEGYNVRILPICTMCTIQYRSKPLRFTNPPLAFIDGWSGQPTFTIHYDCSGLTTRARYTCDHLDHNHQYTNAPVLNHIFPLTAHQNLHQ